MAKKIEEMKGKVRMSLSTDKESFKDEVWLDIPGYEGRYMLSNYARIKSVIKNVPVILKKTISSGRLKVVLVDKRGRQKNKNCGILVAEVFHNIPDYPITIIYKDRNPFNDLPENIEVLSRKERHKTAILKPSKGEENGMAVLTAIQVSEIRKKKNSGKTLDQLKNEYHVSKTCIHNIVTFKNWKNI